VTRPRKKSANWAEMFHHQLVHKLIMLLQVKIQDPNMIKRKS